MYEDSSEGPGMLFCFLAWDPDEGRVCLPCYRKPQVLFGILFSLLFSVQHEGSFSLLCGPCFFLKHPQALGRISEGSRSHSQWAVRLILVPPTPALWSFGPLGPLLLPRVLLLPIFCRRGFWIEKEREPSSEPLTVRNPLLEDSLPQPHTVV